MLKFLILITSIVIQSSFGQSEKIKGFNLAQPPQPTSSKTFVGIKNTNSNWVSIMPSAFLQKSDPKLIYDTNFQYWGERKQGVIKCIQQAQEQGLKVLVKPHVWMHDFFIGDVDFSLDENKLKTFEENYTRYILDMAVIADSMDVDLFSIGCEMKKLAVLRPMFFKKLISEVRAIYTGELTYAANWDNYKNISFWQDLDYISIDAYFPLCPEKNPQLNVLKEAWEFWSADIKALSDSINEKVIFTEYGFRNIDYNCKEPWRYDSMFKQNDAAQKTAFIAFYQSIWKKEWLAGGFIWTWKSNYHKKNQTNTTFTPQFKSALKVITRYYGYY